MASKITNKKIQELLAAAQELESRGDLEMALDSYSQVLDKLVAEAKIYAQNAGPGIIEAVTGSGAVSESYLVKFKENLKKDRTAAIVSCHMASLFSRMGNDASAKVFFEQAVDLTPDGVVYDDPHVGMSSLGSEKN